MTIPLAAFLSALVLAAIVIAWIAYCMFCRERHKSGNLHYDISDLRHRSFQLSQEKEAEATPVKKEITAGIFFIPSRHKHKDDSYEKRPDYPESPPPVLQPGADKLVELLTDDSVSDADVHYKDGIYEIDSNATYQSYV